MGEQQIEYKVIDFSTDRSRLEWQLNQLGSKGWRLHTAAPHPQTPDTYQLILEREKPEARSGVVY